MRVLSIDSQPLLRIRYLNARKGGGVRSEVLPILRGRVDRLPSGLDALLVASDLQGVVSSWAKGGETHLLGEELADVVAGLGLEGVVPLPGQTGVILAGDLYAAPGGDKRGATGDVRAVWRAFAEGYAWVAGVAGNHDTFGSPKDRQRLSALPQVHLLDTSWVTLGGLVIGGVQHIVGDPRRAGRVAEDDFFASLELVLEASPDVLVLHEGPHADRERRGNAAITSRLLASAPRLTVCGGEHWSEPLASMGAGGQVLNVDARALVLTL